MASDLDSYKLKNEVEKLKQAITEFLPENDGLVARIQGLTPKNSILINSLIDAWKRRIIPGLSEKDIIQQNLTYQSSPERQSELARVGL